MSAETPRDAGARREAALAMTPAEFRALGHALVDRIAAEWTALPEQPVSRPLPTQAEVRAGLGERGLPAQGEDAGAALDDAARLLFAQTPRTQHPRFHGYIATAPAPVGVLGELLAAAVNANVALWAAAPVAAEIEAQTVRWLAELVGYPPGCGGLLVSGGSAANFVGLLAARRARLPWNVRERGLQGAALAVYASHETHAWLPKACDLAGLGSDALRWIDTDARQRLDIAALAAAIEADIAAGVRPLMAVGSAGTVATGAVDPLPAMAALCRRHGLWFHVDGAYGAPAACLLGSPHAALLGDAAIDLDGLAEADSLALDPHKWLYAPIEAGCVLMREPSHLHDSFGQQPAYYASPGEDEGPSFHGLGPQNTRGQRALKVWLALRVAGRDGYRRMISDDIALAQRLFARVAATPGLEAVGRQLGVATFRFRPTGPHDDGPALDDLNRRLLDRLQADGRAYLSHSRVGGRFLLRACIANFRTGPDDVDALPGLVCEQGQALLRPVR